MKSHESILSGLRFSLTGAVCHSRDIDQAITSLTDGGFLNIVDGTAFVGEHVPEFGNTCMICDRDGAGAVAP
jgi:hypothetical protein